MVMDGYYPQDRLQEIWQQINSLHLGYLEFEESTQKIEHRNKLEDCINDYLCLAPHNRKFYLKETAEVLHRSASSKKDFSGYRAALGWNAIGMYAVNLLSQPWRQEYREIKMYSGFYKHQIDANLVGAEVMFEAMGYKHTGDDILVLEGPVCPDRVANVSQDSLVAYVECQILKAIWEEVSTTFNITWLEVLKFRETHLCSPKQSVTALNYNYHHRQYQEHTRGNSNTNCSYAKDPYHNNTRYSQQTINPSLLPNHYSTHSGHSHINMSQVQPSCMYANNCYSNNYAAYAQAPPNYQYMPVTYPHIKAPLYGNGIYCNGYSTPTQQSGFMCPVPTAQLIELEQHTYDVPDGEIRLQNRAYTVATEDLVNRSNNRNYDLDDRYSNHKTIYDTPARNSSHVSESLRKTPSDHKNSDKEEGSGTFGSWDYVYRNLENQGYTKDLGERGDVLQNPAKEEKNRIKEAKKISVEIDKLNNLSIDRPLKITEALEKIKLSDSRVRERKNSDPQTSLYDNMSSHDLSNGKLAKSNGKISRSKTLHRNNESELPKYSSKTLELRSNKDLIDDRKINHRATTSNPIDQANKILNTDDFNLTHDRRLARENSQTDHSIVEAKSISKVNKWECKTCTFLNDNSKDICDMCSKTRTKVLQDMEVGGSQCAKCTLVNAKDNKICQACGASLRNSPTYI